VHTTHNGVSLLEEVEELRDELHIEFNCARIACGREKFRRLNQKNREGLAGAGVQRTRNNDERDVAHGFFGPKHKCLRTDASHLDYLLHLCK